MAVFRTFLLGLLALVCAVSGASSDTPDARSLRVNLAFPLNDTYAPPDGPFPVIFKVPRDPLLATLGLVLEYYLFSAADDASEDAESIMFGHGSFDLYALDTSGAAADMPYYAYGYSANMTGLEGPITLQTVANFRQCHTNYRNGSLDASPGDYIYQFQFVLQSGAKPPVFGSDISAAVCTPASWQLQFLVDDVIDAGSQGNNVACAKLDSIAPVYTKTACAVQVDATAAASISAAIASSVSAAPATTTAESHSSTIASSSTEPATASTAPPTPTSMPVSDAAPTRVGVSLGQSFFFSLLVIVFCR